MVKITNEAKYVDDFTLPTSKSQYLKINDTLFIFGISSDVKDDIINKFKDNQMTDVNFILFLLFDKYAAIEDLEAGFGQLLDYFIYENQWFLENTVAFVCIEENVKNKLETVLKKHQRKITQTDEIWPSNDDTFLSVFNPAIDGKEARTGISLNDENPFLTLTFAFQKFAEYDLYIIDNQKIDDEKEYTSGSITVNGSNQYEVKCTLTSFNSDSGITVTKLRYINKEHHLIINMMCILEIAKFLGGFKLTVIDREMAGKITVDIFDTISRFTSRLTDDYLEALK